jgi:precorrin-6B C5,15-methyltransferase / cobalt-precorrin-6B C5,C15-methyltransferase
MSPEVTVIGCDGRPFGPEAAHALATAELVIGAPRHLDAAALQANAERKEIKHLDEALDTLDARSGPTAVLASGDPGFFGIVRALRARGIRPAVIPAVSSVALAFARLGLDWDDALVVSAHGRDPRHALAAALAHPKAAILTAPGTARDLARELLAAGKTVVVAESTATR